MGDIESFVRLIAGSNESEKAINITGFDKTHLKSDCINGSIVKGTREPILNSCALDKPLGHKIYMESRIKLFKKVNKSVLSHIMFYLDVDDHKPVDFNGKTICFICQIVKI